MNVAILIAVEEYFDKDVPAIKYAKTDALEFGAAIREHGFAQEIFIDGEATKTILESKIKSTIQSLEEADHLFIYYVGHRFSIEGRNYLTCRDTLISDLVATSIPLDSLFTQLRDSRCSKITMFIDSSASDLLTSAPAHSPYGDLEENELTQFVEEEAATCFLACEAGESSFPSQQNRRGAWSYHLTQAFRGNASDAINRDSLLTNNSLQRYLQLAVPRTLRLEFPEKRPQTPWMAGANGDTTLGDLSDILAVQTATKEQSQQIVSVSLVAQQTGEVRRLSGFKKRLHSIPDEISNRTSSFVGDLATPEIDKDIDQKYRALREQFKFKRADMNVSDISGGSGTIITPFFNYSVSVSLNPANASEVIWHRQVSEIKDSEPIFSDEFAYVFDELFDTVEFSPPTKVDLEAFIDHIEELDDDRIDLQYDRSATWCDLVIEGIGGKVHVTAATLRMVLTKPEAPRQLLEAFFEMQNALADEHGMRLLEVESKEAH